MKSRLEKLEMLRGFAAMYVFAGHLLLVRLLVKQSFVGFVFRFGQEAVMLFFLISGFVIYYSTAKHGDRSLRPYLVRRIRRIYPIFIVALLLSWAVNPSFLQLGSLVREGMGNLFMLQDFKSGKPGVWIPPFCGNRPLWSLSYEWWFYMMFFPIYRLVPRDFQIHLVALLSLLGLVSYYLYFNQVSLFLLYFITWWCGAEIGYAYLEKRHRDLIWPRFPLFYLACFTALLGVPVLLARHRGVPLSAGIHPVLELRHFAACLIFLSIGVTWKRFRWIGFQPIFRPFLVAAPISYAVYVFHFPLCVTGTYLDWIPVSVLRIAFSIGLTFTAAYLAEIPFQKWINRLTVRYSESGGIPSPAISNLEDNTPP